MLALVVVIAWVRSCPARWPRPIGLLRLWWSGHGLAVALESLVARATVPVALDVGLDVRPPEAVKVAAYYVISEALASIGKHSSATSAEVTVESAINEISVRVLDDGDGQPAVMAGFGLGGLRDRVEALGGHLQVCRLPTGGVCVEAELQCR